jgi:hypothetical protein
MYACEYRAVSPYNGEDSASTYPNATERVAADAGSGSDASKSGIHATYRRNNATQSGV